VQVIDRKKKPGFRRFSDPFGLRIKTTLFPDTSNAAPNMVCAFADFWLWSFKTVICRPNFSILPGLTNSTVNGDSGNNRVDSYFTNIIMARS
jgi:hypothetical protein